MPVSSKWTPLIKDTAMQPGAVFPRIFAQRLPRNWCGRTKMRMWAPLAAETTSGSAMTFLGSLMPGMYLVFSWSSLMMSVSLRPCTNSSNTHIRTSSSRWFTRAQFWPTILAMAQPQLPLPMMATRFFLGMVWCSNRSRPLCCDQAQCKYTYKHTENTKLQLVAEPRYQSNH